MMNGLRWTLLIASLAATGAAHGAAGDTDLGALLAEAEANHPELRALVARREAAARVPSQLEALPDPTLTAAYTNESFGSFTLGSTPDSSLAFTWTQEVPYPGKRRLAGEVARGEWTAAERELELARVRIRGRVKRLYLDLHRIDRARETLAETSKVLASFVEAARTRYESGEGTLENVLKAQTELTALEVDVAQNVEERRGTEALLSAALGRNSDTPFGAARALPASVPPDRATVEAQALTISPELRALEAAADTESRRVDLARRNLKPDLMYGAGYSNRGGLDPMIMGMFGVRLPLHRARRQAQAVTQSEYELEAARRTVDSGKNELLARVRELCAKFDRAAALTLLYSDGLIPQARSTLDAALGSYAAGKTDFLALLDAAIKVLRYENEHERQRIDALQALTALEEITGTELVSQTGDIHE